MKRIGSGWVAVALFLALAGHAALAQSSIDALEQELKEVQQQQQDTSAQNLAAFFQQVDAAMASPDAAVTLYQAAGGTLPDPTPVTTQHESESASEKEARLAQDQANATAVGAVLQVHCGLLHYAALFITSPQQKGLQDDFNAWLQRVAPGYPQLNMPAPPAAAPDASGGGDEPGRHHHRFDGPHSSFNLGDLKGRAMRDSMIAKYLGFKAWGDKEQGGWAVKDLPRLYRADILEPLRTTPNPATLTAWDTYIAMAQSDQPDTDHWTSIDAPPLQFDRACDDYAISPDVDKLEVLLQIIHANLTHPQAPDWIAREKQLLDDYRAKHGGAPVVAQNAAAPAPAPSGPSGATTNVNSNVSVTTEQQGDATIVTTHTNAPPVAPTP